MKLLSFLFVFSFSFYTHATYIEIEDEDDVVRVYNTINSFWCGSYLKEMNCLVKSINNKDENFENEESRKALEKIKRSTHSLVKLAKEYKRDFFSDLIKDIKYIKKHEELVTQILKEEGEDYLYFYTELELSRIVLEKLTN